MAEIKHDDAAYKEDVDLPAEPPQPRSWLSGLMHRMNNLPEYRWRGKYLSGVTLNRTITIVANTGFLMFGYDQGVLSALLTLDDFQRQIKLMAPLETSNPLCWTSAGPPNRNPDQCWGDPNTQAAGVAIYQIGCFFGALVILFYGERMGRRSSTFWGSLIMIIGTIMQALAFEYGLFVAGRVVGGIGNGMVTSTIPTWQSECARPEKRGKYIMLSGALISFGIAISYWIDYGFFFLSGSIRWRFPIAFQSFFTILVMIGLLFLPDSPRWLLLRGRTTEARSVTARLLGVSPSDPLVSEELSSISAALRLEQSTSTSTSSMKQLFRGGPRQNRRRTLLGVLAQFFQQICGINLVTYYATFLFENSLGFGPSLSRLLAAANGTEYFLASLVPLFIIDRVGRRKLMLAGALGMLISMAVLAGTTSTGTADSTGAPQLAPAAGWTAVAFLFVFNSFFALGWLGMTWMYPAELASLRTRIQANSLSTCSNWLSNFLIVMITPPAFANLQYRTYIIFAVFNAAIVPCVFWLFPETRGRSLEEMDVVFAKAHKEHKSPVKVAREMPFLKGQELSAQYALYLGKGDEEGGSEADTGTSDAEK